jgi:probable F420-dependent oxidoreductase
MMPAHPFRFGIINEQMTTRADWTERAQRAEALGFSTFLIRDHFVPDFFGVQFAPVAALMAAAAATTTLRIGTLVFDNDFRHPVVLAKEAATLDLLSDGRLELGIGAGWLRSEYAGAGLDYDTAGVRIDRLDESLQILKGLFGEGPVQFSGCHYQIEGLEGYPKPVQQPGPPILIGAGKPRMLKLAGKVADIVGIMTSSVATGVVVEDVSDRMWAAVERQVALVREGAGDRFPDIELSTVATFIITDDRHAATEQLIAKRRWSGVTPEQVWSMPAIFIGSLDQIAADMHLRREQLGFSYYVIDSASVDRVAPIVERLAGALTLTRS